MKVILFMAITPNGIIARKNGDEDFLSLDNWFTFVKLATKVGCFVYGRKTYEAVKKWQGSCLEDLKDVYKVVISTDKKLVPSHDFMLAYSPKDAINQLSSLDFKSMIVTGGSTINAAFAKEGLIDEIVLNIEPYMLGGGISLFAPSNFEFKLKYLGSKKITQSIVQLTYKVVK